MASSMGKAHGGKAKMDQHGPKRSKSQQNNGNASGSDSGPILVDAGEYHGNYDNQISKHCILE